MKIGVVADIHCGPDSDTQLGSQAPVLLEGFCDAMEAFGPDLLVDLGDRINPVASRQDRQRTVWVRRRLLEIGVPVLHVLGNTDVGNLTKAELAPLLEQGRPYACLERYDPRIVLLNSQDPPFEQAGGEIGPEQMAWLADVLERGSGPALIFGHHPLDEQDLRGHRYFAAHPDRACVRNRERVRGLLERSGRVLAVFAGHLHWTRAAVINGIPYVTLGSLVDCAYTGGRPAGTFAAVTIRGRNVEVRVSGLQPEQFHFGTV